MLLIYAGMMRMNTAKNAGKIIAVRRYICVVLLAAASIFAARPAAALDKPYTASGDYVLFDIDTKIIYCEGQTELLYGMMRMQAEKMRVDVKTHVVYAEGRVVIQTMMPMTLRESAEESRAEGQDGAPETEEKESPQEQSVVQIQKIEESVRQGNVLSYEGDVLVYDLFRKGGVLMKTREEVRKIYLQGETLDVVSELPLMAEPGYLYEEPSIMANAWTAKRIRVTTDEGKYEGWSTTLWVKGNKVFSTPLPYYTNTGKGITPGNLRLKRVSYSSNTDWNIGAQYEYSEKKGREGTMDLRYAADGKQWYSASVNQRFNLGKKLSGNLGMGNILSGRRSYNMSMTRYSGGSNIRSFNMGYNKGGSRDFSINSSKKIFGINTNSIVTASRSGGGSFARSNVKALMRFADLTKYIDNKKKFSYRVNSSVAWENVPDRDTDASMFVGVSLFRSAIRLSEKSSMNTSFNVNLGRDTGGGSSDSYSSALSYNMGVGKNRNLGVSYKVGQNLSSGRTNASQYMSLSYSFTQFNVMNVRFSSSYDLRESRLGTVSSRLSYEVSKKSSFWTDLVYDVKRSRFNIKNYSLSYNLYGSMLNTRWYMESNEFVMDMATKF